MPNTSGKTTEYVRRGGNRHNQLRLPRSLQRSDRCRSTTDVPYRLRCARTAGHDLSKDAAEQPHTDKHGKYVW